ncbi:aminodeoxyfutalosine deaminase [bacterium BMS3Abin02]|nr:aminodeoxyfutalosine deaminase [bacterium BMS3Abin02]GBE23708.1 aminodeoxyfutalosine deaminase [bacterium BMS3Bbin01]
MDGVCSHEIIVNTLPKVLLHDHLDGGLRIDTILDLAEAQGYALLPETDERTLAAWFYQGGSGSLVRYLESFRHTIGVMQTGEALERVGYEAVLDTAADGVVYAEFRFAPTNHTELGLTPEEVVEATLAGLHQGSAETGMFVGLILDAMRERDDSPLVARLASTYSHLGVVGFDLAGSELDVPADRHLVATRMVRGANMGLTIHAGEVDGPHSIWTALQRCGAHRVGHGVHIIDDCKLDGTEIVELGSLATYVRDFRVPLEVCPTSNLHTGDWSASSHPVGALHRAGFTITLNTDNRLMSRTSLSSEFRLVVEHHGFERSDLLQVTENAMMAAFAPLPVKRSVLEERIRGAYV